VRFFACLEDWSNEPPDAPLPDAIATGAEPFLNDGGGESCRQRQAVVFAVGLGAERHSGKRRHQRQTSYSSEAHDAHDPFLQLASDAAFDQSRRGLPGPIHPDGG
jgi:hypothetical protein